MIILVLQRFTEGLIGVNIFNIVHRISSIFCEAIYFGRGDFNTVYAFKTLSI